MKTLALLMVLLCQDASPFRLPVIDSTPPAPQPVEPKPVTVLPEDSFFVIESEVQAIVLHSPDGLLSVTEDQGPIRLRGKFAGGSGRVETKTFSGKYVYTIEGVKAGKAELILIPSGVVSSDQIVRLMLSVNGAQPPPDDDKDDDKPTPPPTPTADALHLDIVEDSLNRSVQTATTLNALLAWSAFLDNNSFRIWDKSNQAEKAVEARKELGDTKLPAMVVRDKASRKVIRVLELPESFESLKRVLQELGVE